MKTKVNEFVDLFTGFHELTAPEQVVRLVYFHTAVEARETINSKELEKLFSHASVPVPRNLHRLLAGLCGKGRRLIQEGGEYKLRREVAKQIEAELAAPSPNSSVNNGVGPRPFEFKDRVFKDKKVESLLTELDRCYSTDCWNACGILMRIILERTLESIDPDVKTKEGLKAKLNYCISGSTAFSKTVKEALRHLEQAKIVGDIVAHHSNIVLEQRDLGPLILHFRMLIKEASNI